MQQLLKEYDENFSVIREQTETYCSINPVKQLWEWKGICFPGKGVLLTKEKEKSATRAIAVILSNVKHDESLKTCPVPVSTQDGEQDYSLTLLFEAAQLVDDS